MLKVILIAVFAVFAIVSKAQPNADETTLIKSVYGMQKRDLVAKHMKLEAGQAALFWQMYDEYEIARREIGLKRANNIIVYASKYGDLTDADADALLKESLAVQTSFIKLWDTTYKKMAKSLSPVTAAQFIQAEMFLENTVRQELALEIPLIGEFDVKK